MATLFARLGRIGVTLMLWGTALGWLTLAHPHADAQDFGAQPPRARQLLKSARELYVKGDYEVAEQYYQQALQGQGTLTPTEQADLAAQMQQNATAL